MEPLLFVSLSASFFALLGLTTIVIRFYVRERLSREHKVDVVIRRGSVELQLSAKGDLREVNRMLDEVLNSIGSLEDVSTTVETRSEAEATFAIVRAFNQVERAAAEFVAALDDKARPSTRRLSVFEMLRVIQREQAWSSEDSQKFSKLINLRNSVVHEDGRLNQTAEDTQRVVDDANYLSDLLRKRTNAQKQKEV